MRTRQNSHKNRAQLIKNGAGCLKILVGVTAPIIKDSRIRFMFTIS